MSDRVIAGDPKYKRRIEQEMNQLFTGVRYHSIKLPDGTVLPGLQSIETLERRLSVFRLPQDLRGKRVLDIGAWDGWFSFELEKRGAEVVALDCMPFRTFLQARELLGSKVEYRVMDVDEMTPEELGYFDIVLFFGVLYHLRHPLAALERVLALTKGTALVESYVTPPVEGAAVRTTLEFYETNELGGQIDNWYGPSVPCLAALCRSAGFVQAEVVDELSQRASVICRRHWPTPPETPSVPPPLLHVATTNRDYVSVFRLEKDEYLTCFFECEGSILKDELYVDVDGYGTPVITFHPTGPNKWQANCLRPPDLRPGVHEVRIRMRRSGYSNTGEILAIHGTDRAPAPPPVPPEPSAGAPRLFNARYEPPHDLRYLDNGELSCSFHWPGKQLGAWETEVLFDGEPWQVRNLMFLGDYWRANVATPDVIAGTHRIQVRAQTSGWSNELTLTV